MPKVSVIVPVYGAEAYLDQCVGSVLNQRFEDWELILVDDGSPDNSPGICDSWAKKDDRVRVIHKENGGVSSARNAGLDAAYGQFITFLDSDDFLDGNFLGNAVEEAEKFGLDIYAAGIVFFSTEEKQRIETVKQTICSNCNQIDEGDICHLLEKNYISSCCGKLLRAAYIEEYRFKCGCAFGEDLQFVFSLIKKSGKIKAVPEAYYYYRNNPDSATKHFSEKKIKDVIATYEYLNDFATEKNFDILKEVVKRRWVADYTYIQNVILNSGLPIFAQYRRLRVLLGHREWRREVLQNGNERARIVATNPKRFLVKRGLYTLRYKISDKFKL